MPKTDIDTNPQTNANSDTKSNPPDYMPSNIDDNQDNDDVEVELMYSIIDQVIGLEKTIEIVLNTYSNLPKSKQKKAYANRQFEPVLEDLKLGLDYISSYHKVIEVHESAEKRFEKAAREKVKTAKVKARNKIRLEKQKLIDEVEQKTWLEPFKEAPDALRAAIQLYKLSPTFEEFKASRKGYKNLLKGIWEGEAMKDGLSKEGIDIDNFSNEMKNRILTLCNLNHDGGTPNS
ncbi:BAR domain-containing protein [Paraglaciecola psychrophila]|uniref:Uncharacterized protein n=1 Tax=Paraglaciecola psychrophila 170 TaxID=1129794 RepID=K6ZNJ6_9ALTE|nr:hypothetical protein [Paraglaciecola psychrophila]AGH45853.1 hypothetical protein C427_3745 [Paraglaciecola psychrophila 170]GAC37526.1 hypothetical protein GPSY_1902 [Paraglaciecola psychrophila 170]